MTSPSPSTADPRPAVAFVTLGCPKNEVDSDRMAASLSESFRVVAELDEADVAVVNTCSFIQDATEESIEVVLDLATEHARCDPLLDDRPGGVYCLARVVRRLASYAFAPRGRATGVVQFEQQNSPLMHDT